MDEDKHVDVIRKNGSGFVWGRFEGILLRDVNYGSNKLEFNEADKRLEKLAKGEKP